MQSYKCLEKYKPTYRNTSGSKGQFGIIKVPINILVKLRIAVYIWRYVSVAKILQMILNDYHKLEEWLVLKLVFIM